MTAHELTARKYDNNGSAKPSVTMSEVIGSREDPQQAQ
jgi:hypothetical protein